MDTRGARRQRAAQQQQAAREEAAQAQLPLPEHLMSLVVTHLRDSSIQAARQACRGLRAAVDAGVLWLCVTFKTCYESAEAQRCEGRRAGALIARFPQLYFLELRSTSPFERVPERCLMAMACELAERRRLGLLEACRVGRLDLPLCRYSRRLVQALQDAERESCAVSWH